MDETVNYKLRTAVGKVIKEYRLKKNWSQAKLGNEVGMEGNDISRFELGKRLPAVSTLIKLLYALDLDLNDHLEDLYKIIQEYEDME